jgi:hypothetical protein
MFEGSILALNWKYKEKAQKRSQVVDKPVEIRNEYLPKTRQCYCYTSTLYV